MAHPSLRLGGPAAGHPSTAPIFWVCLIVSCVSLFTIINYCFSIFSAGNYGPSKCGLTKYNLGLMWSHARLPFSNPTILEDSQY